MTARTGTLALALAALTFAVPAFAQTADTTQVDPRAWKFFGSISLNFSQSAFSQNWAGGDNGSVAWTFKNLTSGQRQFSEHFNLSNTLELAFGQTASQSDSPNGFTWDRPDKSTDVIRFESVGRWTLGGITDPYAAFNVESQFLDESDDRGTIVLNPVKIKESVGAARVLFKDDKSEGITRLGFAVRQTLGEAFIDPAGLQTQNFTSNDYGIEWQTDVKKPFFEDKLQYQGTLLVLQALGYSASDDLEQVDAALRAADPTRESISDFWKATDFSFRNDFTAKIVKNFGVTLTAQLVYDKYDVATLVDPALASSTDPAVQASYAQQVDKNVRKAGQFREVMALQISYRMF
jgi:hypothetical protein